MKVRFLPAALAISTLLCCVLPSSCQVTVAQTNPTTGSDARQLERSEGIKDLPSKNKRWALVIGVDDYSEARITKLSGAANDARTLADALVKYAGFPEDQVIVITSNQPAGQQPRRSTILRYLSNLRGTVPKDGLLLVSFAGHGIERNGRAFLLPSDALGLNDMVLLEDTAISVERIKESIRATDVAQVILILDACRSDPAAGRSRGDNLMTSGFRKSFNFDLRNEGIRAFATLYATNVGERAYEYEVKKQGYFTWAMVAGLQGAAANERGEVTLIGLVKYLQDKVPKLVALDYGAKVIQRPFAQIEGYRADELVISVPGTAERRIPETSGEAVNSGADFTGGTTGVNQISAYKRNRGAKAGKVLVLFGTSMPPPYEENPKLLVNLSGPLLSALAKRSLSVTSNLDTQINGLEMSRLIRISGKLKSGDVAAGRSIPYALVLQVSVYVSELPRYDGLYVTEAKGTIEAVDTVDGSTVAVEQISSVRGFGITLSQSKGDVLKNVVEVVSESFLKQVAASAY